MAHAVSVQPLEWEDFKRSALKLAKYTDPATWPDLSSQLRELVLLRGKEKHMPKDVGVDAWQQIIDNWNATHSGTPSSVSTTPASSRTNSRSNSYMSDSYLSNEQAQLSRHQVIVYRARMEVKGVRGKAQQEHIVLEPTVRLALRMTPSNCYTIDTDSHTSQICRLWIWLAATTPPTPSPVSRSSTARTDSSESISQLKISGRFEMTKPKRLSCARHETDLSASTCRRSRRQDTDVESHSGSANTRIVPCEQARCFQFHVLVR